MPVKRRSDKRRLGQAAELKAWEGTFSSGFDYFKDLAEIGIETDYLDRPSTDDAADAWRRLGALYMDGRGADRATPSWAERTLGAADAG